MSAKVLLGRRVVRRSLTITQDTLRIALQSSESVVLRLELKFLRRHISTGVMSAIELLRDEAVLTTADNSVAGTDSLGPVTGQDARTGKQEVCETKIKILRNRKSNTFKL